MSRVLDGLAAYPKCVRRLQLWEVLPMPLPLYIAVALASSPTPQDTSISIVAAYTAILEHAASRYPSRAGLPIVIADKASNWACAPFCVDTTFVNHVLPTELVEQLTDSGLIEAACAEPDRTIGCPSHSGRTFIRLGLPYRVPTNLHVIPGQPLHPSINPIRTNPVDGAEPVDVGVDILIYGPCSAERSPCDYPDIEMYRYFLQLRPDRSFRVVARQLTGAV
jgi:hypothetical protein